MTGTVPYAACAALLTVIGPLAAAPAAGKAQFTTLNCFTQSQNGEGIVDSKLSAFCGVLSIRYA